MESTATFVTLEGVKHVKYENLYFINSEYIFATTDPDIRLEEVYTMGGSLDVKYKDRFTMLPTIKLFANTEELKEYIGRYDFVVVGGITNCLTHYWDHNIAHALYDALYPIYLSLLRYYGKNEPFNILIDVIKVPGWSFPGHASREYSMGIFKAFSKGHIFVKGEDRNYMFSNVIAGTGFAGISGVNSNGVMPGKDISALDKFRDRMFEVYDVKPALNDKLSITIIDSQRYTNDERANLIRLNQKLNASPSQTSRIISWFDIGSFKDQLEIMNSTDIHISGAGSSMLNFPFLNKGKVHINLGVNQINPVKRFGKDACIMPGLLEVNICLLPNSIFVDFYDIYKHRTIEYDSLEAVVQGNIYDFDKEWKTRTPSYVTRWCELCSEHPAKMQQLIRRMTYPQSNYPDLVPIRFMDVVVAGFPPYGNSVTSELLL
jgi:hypothetical protein